MNARDTHIAKYITAYQTIYPAANVLLAKSSFRYYLSRHSARRQISPAVKVIRDILGSNADNTTPQLLIHLFSNGGSCVLYHLYDLYHKTSKFPAGSPDRTLPPHVTIFDSVPGRWSYAGSTNAVLLAIPPGMMRKSAFPFVHLLGAFWVVKYRVIKVPEETHVWGLAHNDRTRAWESCRAYVYSEADEFVDHRAVEEHANHAESNGYVILRRDKFSDSKHVAHAKSDPDRYWLLVKETWEAGNKEVHFIPKN